MRNTTTPALARATLATTAITLCIALAGCGTATQAAQAEQNACTRINTATNDPIITQCDITLNDTRHVTCITTGVQKGITCDWNHASGTDKEPEQ